MSQPTTKPCRCGGDCQCGKANPAVAASGERPVHPKALLLRYASDPAKLRDAAQAAELLFPESKSVGIIRVLGFLAGFALPAKEDVGEFVRALIQGGWQAWPAGMDTPKAGDFAIWTDAQRRPVAMALVAKPSTDGVWCYVVDGPERRRVEASEVDFWVRQPG